MTEEIKKLNLSNNQLRILPVELQCLQNLIEIDLTQNPIDLPDWVSNIKGLTIKTDNLSVISHPLAQEEIADFDISETIMKDIDP